MSKFRYIASCNFTLFYPELSSRILDFMSRRPDVEVIRCCADRYKVREFEEKMPASVAQRWKGIVHYAEADRGTCMVSVCHNCTAVFQEQHPDIRVISLWEYLADMVPDFPYPDYRGEKMTLQDCWRQHDNAAEQAAVRELMRRMNIEMVELEQNGAATTYCGVSTLRPAPRRNLVMAPVRFVQNAHGFFQPHTEEEQRAYMEAYCRQIATPAVVAYCHYCTQGFGLVGQKNFHLAELLFGNGWQQGKGL